MVWQKQVDGASFEQEHRFGQKIADKSTGLKDERHTLSRTPPSRQHPYFWMVKAFLGNKAKSVYFVLADIAYQLAFCIFQHRGTLAEIATGCEANGGNRHPLIPKISLKS